MFTRLAALFLTLTLSPALALAFHSPVLPTWAIAGSSCLPAAPALPLYATDGPAVTMRRHAFSPRDAAGAVKPVVLRCPVQWLGQGPPPWNTLVALWLDTDRRQPTVRIVVRLMQGVGADTRVVARLDSLTDRPPFDDVFEVSVPFAHQLWREHAATYIEIQFYRPVEARSFDPPRVWQVRLETLPDPSE